MASDTASVTTGTRRGAPGRSTQIDVSIVIVNWNVKDRLAQCLDSIARQTKLSSIEIIVVDNASSDGSIQMLKDRFAYVHVRANDRNLGFSPAVNQGIRYAKGRYVLLLNPDTVLQSNAVKALADFLDEHERFGAVTGRLEDEAGVAHRTVRGLPRPLRFFLVTSALRHLLMAVPAWKNHFLVTSDEYLSQGELHNVHGAMFMARREALQRIGGLDEAFFLYLADTDLSFRLAKDGWKLGFTPQAVAMHVGGESSRKQSVRSHVNFNVARLRFYRKHFGAPASALLVVFGILEACCLLPWWTLRFLATGGRDGKARDQLIINLRVLKMYVTLPVRRRTGSER